MVGNFEIVIPIITCQFVDQNLYLDLQQQQIQHNLSVLHKMTMASSYSNWGFSKELKQSEYLFDKEMVNGCNFRQDLVGFRAD